MMELTKKDTIVQMSPTEAAKIVPVNNKIVVLDRAPWRAP